MTETIYFYNDKFVPKSQATVNVDAAITGRGMGVFEGMRGYWDDETEELYLFRVDGHFARQKKSARIMHLRIPYTITELCEITAELMRRNNFREDVHIRPLAYKSTDEITSQALVLPAQEDGYAISVNALGRYLDTTEGIHCCVSSWRRIDDNAAPARAKITGIYVNSALAKTEAVANGFDEAIFLTDEGHVCEGTGENIFLVDEGTLHTPPPTDNILNGITRQTIIELAKKELGLEVVERPVNRTELYLPDECFMTGSGAEVTPVTMIDHRPIGSGDAGPVTQALQDLYRRVTVGRLPGYEEWIIPCYGEVAAQSVS